MIIFALFVLLVNIGANFALPRAIQNQTEPVFLKRFNFNGTLATLEWSDGKETTVKLVATSLEDCIYKGSFQEDQGSSILG